MKLLLLIALSVLLPILNFYNESSAKSKIAMEYGSKLSKWEEAASGIENANIPRRLLRTMTTDR